MTRAVRPAAQSLLGIFLGDDIHYRASAQAYGDGGATALARALALFIDRPELGFVWVAHTTIDTSSVAIGACVVCRAISTSCGAVVAKLDDVCVHPDWLARGVGGAMLTALIAHLRLEGIARIDSACHRDNAGAWRFYERLGFVSLDEERIALLL
ncbi:MAG: GNAT family N-acetyltransferase [Betaproteobacteria bacterium]